MKKIFAFAMALVSMAAVMTSCNNDDAAFIEQKAPTTATVQEQTPREMMDIDFVVAVTAEQQDYYNESYIVEFGGEQHTIAISDMKPATVEQINAFNSPQQIADATGIDQLRYYSFTVGQTNVCKGGKILSHNVEIKADHPTDVFKVMVNASCFVVNGRVASDYISSRAMSVDGNSDECLNGYVKIAKENYN